MVRTVDQAWQEINGAERIEVVLLKLDPDQWAVRIHRHGKTHDVGPYETSAVAVAAANGLAARCNR